jgi:hypothetical protein
LDEFNKEAFMNKRIIIVTIICLAALLTLTVSLGMAQQESTGQSGQQPEAEQPTVKSEFIPVQGRLTDASGSPLNGSYIMDFRIYDVNSGGVALCVDPSNTVNVDNGLFNTYVDIYGCGAFDGRQLYLGITVEGDPEMTPRQYIGNVPYAISLRPGALISSTMSSNAILDIQNWGQTGRGLRSYAMSLTGENYGVVGASRSPAGFGGYFYNNGGGVGLKGSSSVGTGLLGVSVDSYGVNASSTNGIGLLATSENNAGIWATSVNGAAIHGAGGMGAGVEGYSVSGPGVYGESLTDGVAIAANGIITSTAPTYLWISGSGIQPYQSTDSTVINMDTTGGALVERGVTGGSKYVMLPVTIPGVLYGQNVTISAIDIYWVGETEFDSLSNIRVRLQTGGVCPSCYDDLLYDSTAHVCDLSNHPTGCVAHYDLTTNNVLSPAAGVIHIGFGLSFSGSSTYVDIGGVRLTLEYDN